MVKKKVFVVIVAVLAILFEGFNALSEDDLNFLTEYEEKEEEHDVDNGITIEVRASNCKDRGLPRRLSKDKNCKRLKLSCIKLKSKCNGKLGSNLGNTASARKCRNKLSSSERNTRVKSFCNKSCKECVAACKDKKIPTGVKCGFTCPKLAKQNRCWKRWKSAGPKKCVKKIKSKDKNKKVRATCPKSCKICVESWGRWGQWSSCSASCEFGTKKRTRRCQEPPCSGRSSETKTCSEQPVCGCGKASGRIVGGGPVAKNSIPWQVGMVFWGHQGPSCGGTLISPKHVLTAAHCYDGFINFDMVLGDHHKYDPDGETVHEVCRVAYHPKYDEATAYDYDFAVVTLKEPVEFDSKVTPACLADTSMIGDKLAGKKAIVSGWGKLNENGVSPDVLHKVEVPVISSKKCDQYYSDSWYDITSSMICAGETNGQIDSCQGDSGGPMTYEKGGKTYLIGVVSWGIGCARAGRPGVYARVSRAKDWIIEQMTKQC